MSEPPAMNVVLWSPCPHTGGLGAVLARLEPDLSIETCTGPEPPPSLPEGALHLFHVDDSPEHAYVVRALRDRPGVVLLAEWNLHRVARHEARSRGGVGEYLREAERAHGKEGVFVARQEILGRGSALLRARFPLNDRVLESSLALVGFTRAIAEQAAQRLSGRPIVHLPVGLAAPRTLPERGTARREVGLAAADAVVVALRGAADEQSERTAAALAALAAATGSVVVRWAAAGDPQSESLVAAADVVVALEHPVRGSLDPLVIAAMAASRPVLVTAGGAAARQFAPGAVVPVSPGATESAEVAALVARLLDDAPLRQAIGRRARAAVVEGGDVDALATTLLGVVRSAATDLEPAVAAWKAQRPDEGTPTGEAIEKMRWAARDLGLVGYPLDLRPLVGDLLEPRPD